jgi:hypothetical protein
MGRTCLHKELSVENVFARMTPGRTYPAYVIAAKFKVPTKAVRPFLDELIRTGAIEHSHALAKTLGFRKPGAPPSAPAPARTPFETSVAAPATPPNLNSTLTGYEHEIRSWVELCLMTRSR